MGVVFTLTLNQCQWHGTENCVWNWLLPNHNKTNKELLVYFLGCASCDNLNVARSHHDIEILASLLAFCKGNPPVTTRYPSQGADNANVSYFCFSFHWTSYTVYGKSNIMYWCPRYIWPEWTIAVVLRNFVFPLCFCHTFFLWCFLLCFLFIWYFNILYFVFPLKFSHTLFSLMFLTCYALPHVFDIPCCRLCFYILSTVFAKLHRHISFCLWNFIDGRCWSKFFCVKMYWTPAKMLLLADVDECSFVNPVSVMFLTYFVSLMCLTYFVFPYVMTYFIFPVCLYMPFNNRLCYKVTLYLERCLQFRFALFHFSHVNNS